MIVNNKKVLVGMSGGVDSLVTSLLLKQQGYEVIGATLCFTDKNINTKGRAPAKILAEKLYIPHYDLDVAKDFKNNVIDFVLSEHTKGRTPCACARCNPLVKFNQLLNYADYLECNYIATGHYVSIKRYNNHTYVYKGVDPVKDQSYFLYDVHENVLERLLTPLGDYKKSEVKNIAAKHGFEKIAKGKESMGICFLQKSSYHSFLKNNLPSDFISEGPVKNQYGKIVGKHSGSVLYTIGQRKGFLLHESHKSYRVSGIDTTSNTLVVNEKENLYCRELILSDVHFINPADIALEGLRAVVRGIGHNPEGYCKLVKAGNSEINVHLDEPAWAVAPGQPVVFYKDDRLLGGGVVKEV